MIEFDIPKEKSSIIKVFGIGGGGSNAVNYMYELGIQGVNYVICNTDNQALETSNVPNKVQLGSSLRAGLGAGSKPEIGKEATVEAIDQLEDILQTNTKMVFITAGMGGGTGTGGAPVVARLAKDMGILTVGIVTTPFVFEGKKRLLQAEAGIAELKKEVDALLIISNEKLRVIHGNLRMGEAFARADDILAIAAKGIAEIITKTGYINVDFEDVNTVMKDSGVALMGIGTASGENRAIVAAEEAMASPLLNDNNIVGANNILLNVSNGVNELTMDEVGEISDYVADAIGVGTDNLIFGYCEDDTLEADEVRVTLIATGFESTEERHEKVKNAKVVHTLQPTEKACSSRVNSEAKEEHVEVTEEVDPSKPYLKTEEVEGAPQITFDFTNEKPNDKVKDMFSFKPIVDDQSEEITTEEVEHVSNAEPVTSIFTLREEEKEEEQPELTFESRIVETEEEVQSIEETTSNENPDDSSAEQEDILENTQDERIQRLKSFSLKVKNTKDIEELENEPAYLRKKVEFEETPNSKDQNISRLNLSENEDGVEIRKNSFLHDNVD